MYGSLYVIYTSRNLLKKKIRERGTKHHGLLGEGQTIGFVLQKDHQGKGGSGEKWLWVNKQGQQVEGSARPPSVFVPNAGVHTSH